MSPRLSPPPRRLLAVDLDGTLLRADSTIDPRDTAALARARRAGVLVTLATGRLAPAAIFIARALALKEPLICADGAALVCARTGAVIESAPLPAAARGALVEVFAAHSLAPFVFLADAIAADGSGRAYAALIRPWSPMLVFQARLDQAAWAGAVTALGVGPRERVEAALVAARGRAPAVELAAFGLGEGAPWALRAAPRDADKAIALARLAARLGVRREDVAAVGDWLNDITMLAWAGRSFAMGQSPPCVREAADCVLEATTATGGGVGEAVARWLAG